MKEVLAAETERAQSVVGINQNEPIRDLATANRLTKTRNTEPDWD